MKKLFVLICLTGLLSCQHQEADTTGEGDKLMALSREWSTAAGSGDMEKTLSYWADDAVVMAPGQPPLKGKDAIKGMLMGTANIPGFNISWEPLSVSVSKSGDMAWLVEQNKISYTDSTGTTITDYNKAVTVWRKEADGNWKNVADIWNGIPAPVK